MFISPPYIYTPRSSLLCKAAQPTEDRSAPILSELRSQTPVQRLTPSLLHSGKKGKIILKGNQSPRKGNEREEMFLHRASRNVNDVDCASNLTMVDAVVPVSEFISSGHNKSYFNISLHAVLYDRRHQFFARSSRSHNNSHGRDRFSCVHSWPDGAKAIERWKYRSLYCTVPCVPEHE